MLQRKRPPGTFPKSREEITVLSDISTTLARWEHRLRTEKVVSGLRLVCSTKTLPAMGSESIIAVYWNGMFGNTNQKIDVKVDGKSIHLTTPWDQDNQIVFRKISESTEMIQAMKTGRNITFNWVGTDSAKRITTISLRDFNQRFGEFNNSCKTQ